MAKEKKLTLNYVFHQSVKGITLPNGKQKFPLYIEIIYNREISRFAASTLMPELDTKDKFKNPFYLTDKEIENFNKTDLGDKIKDWLYIVLAFEMDLFKEKFSIKGFGSRVKFYKSKAYDGLKKIIADRALKEKINPDLYLIYNFFIQIFEENPKLKKTYVIEWLMSDKLILNQDVEDFINSIDAEHFEKKIIDFFIILFPDYTIFFDNDMENIKKHIKKRLFLKSE